MRPYQDVFDVSHIEPTIRSRLSAAKNRHLAWLGEKGMGIVVSRDLDDVRAFWDEHRGPDGPLEIPNFDPQFWPNASEQNTLVLFLVHGDELIGMMGYRLIDLFDSRNMHPLTLREAIESLRYYYLDPAMAPAGETAQCRIHAAELIQDCVICVAGGVWITKKWRGLDLFKVFGRLARIAAITAPQFLWSWKVLVFSERNRELALEHYGLPTYHPLAMRWRDQDWWLATAGREDDIQITLAVLDRPTGSPFRWTASP